MSEEMSRYRLERDGEARLAFSGRCLGEASSHANEGPGQNRWQELALYQAKDGRYVVAGTWRTCWQGEKDRHVAEVCGTDREVLHVLTEWAEGDLTDLVKSLLDEAGLTHLTEEELNEAEPAPVSNARA